MSTPLAPGATALADRRRNQKWRTRAAVLTAASALVDEGRAPTVAEAAARAHVSRATAYRYFPTQALLLVEASLHAATPVLDQVLAPPLSATEPLVRMAAVTTALQSTVLRHEAAFRTLLRLSLEAMPATIPGPQAAHAERRGGRRVHWAEAALAPIRGQLGESRFRRLVAALAVLLGIETLVVLRDVCGLPDDEVTAVTHWAVDALVRQSQQEAAAHP